MSKNNVQDQDHAWRELSRRERKAFNNPPSVIVWHDKNRKIAEECVVLSQARLANWREGVRNAKKNEDV